LAEPYKAKDGTWYARVKDAAGRWRSVRMPEATTKRDAQEYQADLAQKYRRQRDGLDPLPPRRAFTVGKLLRWWLDTYVAGRTWTSKEEDRFRLYFETTDLPALPVAALTVARIELFLQHWSREGLAPASLNHLRAMIRTAFNRARKAALVSGENPAIDVERRKVPKRAPAFLEPHEVQLVLAELSDTDRPIIATALYAGLRKGELFSLSKRDVDLKRRLLMVRRSYEQDTTKGGSEEAVPIALDLVPYFEAALRSTPGALLFPRADGEPRIEQDDLRERLRSAIGRAGLVSGYVHSCRRCKAAAAKKQPGRKPHVEKHADAGAGRARTGAASRSSSCCRFCSARAARRRDQLGQG
jgi:integrase